MQGNRTIEILGRTAVFEGLGEDVLARLAERMRPCRFSTREVLFSRGEPGKSLFLILSGRVRLSVVSEDGRELAFRQATDGEIIGEVAVLDGGTRSADATAISDVQALSLTRSDLTDLMQAEPRLNGRIVSFLCQRLRETSRQLEMIALLPIEARLARLLLAMTSQITAAPVKGFVPLTMGMSQGEIALLLGASRPKVNMAIGMLEASGAVKRQDETYLCHRDRLADLALDGEG